MNCKICNNDKSNTFLEVKEMMFGLKDKFPYMQCGYCGCLQIIKIPDNLADYYPSNYYSFQEQASSHPLSVLKKLKIWLKEKKNHFAITRKGILGAFLYYLSPDEKFFSLGNVSNLHQNTSILDVGCGAGDLLKSLYQLGFQRLKGIDPFIADSIYVDARLQIEKKSIHQLEQTEKFDFIMFHHSFEHMDNPLQVFHKVASLLSEDGLCMIRIPVADSHAFEYYQENWVQLDAPRHIFLHTQRSIDVLAKETGLCVTKTIYDSNELQFWGSEQYIAGISLFAASSQAHSGFLQKLFSSQIRAYRKKAQQLNRTQNGDQAIFFISKASYKQ